MADIVWVCVSASQRFWGQEWYGRVEGEEDREGEEQEDVHQVDHQPGEQQPARPPPQGEYLN